MEQTLEHRKRAVFRLQVRQHIRAASQYRHRLSPARRRVCRAEIRADSQRNSIVRIHSVQPQYRLGDHQANVVLQRVLETLRPAHRLVSLGRRWVHPHLAVIGHRHWERPHIVGERVECAAARQIKARVVPVAGQDAVLHGSPVQRKSHVRTSVVHCEYSLTMSEHCDSMPATRDHRATALSNLIQRPCTNLLVSSNSHSTLLATYFYVM